MKYTANMNSKNANINRSTQTYLDSSYEKYSSYERFKFVRQIMQKHINHTSSFLDIGCAKGEFIWYLKDYFHNVEFTGIDISQKLLSIAKRQQKLESVDFIKADAAGFSLNKRFDCVYMGGVLSIFDDFKKPMQCALKHIKPGGRGYIFGCFNKEDIDVIVRYRNNYAGSKKWESGLNIFSINSIRAALKPFVLSLRFHFFKISTDLPRQKDPVTSYTLNTSEKGRIIANGANIITDFYLVEFKKRINKCVE